MLVKYTVSECLSAKGSFSSIDKLDARVLHYWSVVYLYINKLHLEDYM